MELSSPVMFTIREILRVFCQPQYLIFRVRVLAVHMRRRGALSITGGFETDRLGMLCKELVCHLHVANLAVAEGFLFFGSLFWVGGGTR